ncbi:hypothetical protein DPMN_181145 [Dreissena polymorpha]|uniref:Uncharacterized protein n=1 Tax=Dreissena polymorpha TaxID=45954 RepID=A0A9D4DD43_DREPO|nr:hypothetical protein DPMN_181145 [Dreissena polymorpha]
MATSSKVSGTDTRLCSTALPSMILVTSSLVWVQLARLLGNINRQSAQDMAQRRGFQTAPRVCQQRHQMHPTRPRNLKIIHTYSPTSDYDDEEIEQFYEDSERIIAIGPKERYPNCPKLLELKSSINTANTTTIHGSEIGSDYDLLLTTIELKLKNMYIITNPRIRLKGEKALAENSAAKRRYETYPSLDSGTEYQKTNRAVRKKMQEAKKVRF